jgi:hypothetical protein
MHTHKHTIACVAYIACARIVYLAAGCVQRVTCYVLRVACCVQRADLVPTASHLATCEFAGHQLSDPVLCAAAELKSPLRSLTLVRPHVCAPLPPAVCSCVVNSTHCRPFAALQQEDDPSIVSFFENCVRLRLITCHTFKISEQAFQIPVAINEAFRIRSSSKAAQSDAIAAAISTVVEKTSFAEALRHVSHFPCDSFPASCLLLFCPHLTRS